MKQELAGYTRLPGLPLGLWAVMAILIALGLVSTATAQALNIETISNRADLVSGGDVLVRAMLPPGLAGNGNAVLSLNGQPLADALHPAPDGNGYLALVTGMKVGSNTLVLSVPGRSVQLRVTNYPIGGPIFSGPHLQPWTCTTEANGLGAPIDADCNAAAPQYAFFYKNATSGAFVGYDPANPPASSEIASTTTDRGITVPYIVRVETGTLNRAIYKIMVLFDPSQPWAPWAPQSGWNGKVWTSAPGGASTQYQQGAPNQIRNSFVDQNFGILVNLAGQGFAVISATLMKATVASNVPLNAETFMMVKEHLAETYGPIRYTMVTGLSGDAIMMYDIGDQYPGLWDGFLPEWSYPDMWSIHMISHDCVLFTRYWNTASTSFMNGGDGTGPINPLWANVNDRLAVLGADTEQECPGQDSTRLGPLWFPVTNTSCLLPAGALYDPVTNPHGVRCSLKDYHINQLGVRPQDGFVGNVLDNVGVQYGLRALQAGTISPEQFVDLNQNVGGLDIDGNFQTARTVADPLALQRMYQTGLIFYGRELSKYPVIDARGDANFEMHNNSEWMFTRNRILNVTGRATNHIHWWDSDIQSQPPTLGEAVKAFHLLDSWLTRIEADTSSISHEVKVERNKPSGVFDACFHNGLMYEWRAGSVCESLFRYPGLSRMAAGGPNTNDVLKCQLKPLVRSDYNVTFSDNQWARLQQAFRSGVCDNSKPGVGQQPPIGPWLSYASGPGGVPLGPPPTAQ